MERGAWGKRQKIKDKRQKKLDTGIKQPATSNK